MPIKDRQKFLAYMRSPEQCARRNKHRAENPELYKRYKKESVARKVKWLRDIKRERGCLDCGENHPATLEFHHRGGKDGCLGTMAGKSRGWEVLKKELEKCDVLCANCHRKRHWDAEHGIINNSPPPGGPLQ